MTSPRRGRRWRRATVGATTLLVVLFAALFVSTEQLTAFGAAPEGERLTRMRASPQFHDGAFRNGVATEVMKSGAAGAWREALFETDDRTPLEPLPVEDPRPAWQEPPTSGLRATWLGHSTVLLEVDGARILTDPVWGPRASPSAWVGPRRFHPPPVPLDALPALDAVVLSHDHYDHLDLVTVRALAQTGVPFYAPLGVGAHLEAWGVPKARITELDWWQEASLKDGALTLAATPARHFSGRGLWDRNRTLWASWVVKTPQHRVFFSGDTGLTPQFSQVRERYGPFDLVMLEVGAYHPSWGDIHLGPHNAVEAHRLLGGGPLLPIHWGTFSLAFHRWYEPAETLRRLASNAGIPLLTPRAGTPFEPALARAPALEPWWRDVPKTQK